MKDTTAMQAQAARIGTLEGSAIVALIDLEVALEMWAQAITTADSGTNAAKYAEGIKKQAQLIVRFRAAYRKAGEAL